MRTKASFAVRIYEISQINNFERYFLLLYKEVELVWLRTRYYYFYAVGE